MIQPGQKLPADLPLRLVRDGTVSDTRLGDLLRRPLVVSVHLRDNTPACDRQAASLAARADAIAARGYDLLSVSRDTARTRLAYAAKHRLALPLASDPADGFSRAADAIVEKKLYGKTHLGPARAAYVLAPDATVLAVVFPVETARHGDQILEALDRLA